MPLKDAVVVVVAVWFIVSAGVVRSLARQAHPFVAAGESPIVTVKLHVPLVPLTKLPAEAPPTRVVAAQVLTERVKVVPAMV